MIKLEVELGNFQRFAEKLGITRDQFHYRLWLVIARIAYSIEALAKKAAPRNLSLYPIKHPERRVTGRLRSSLIARDTGGGQSNAVEWKVGTNVEYAEVQELGRKDGRMRPKLFLARGYRQGISKLPDRLMALVKEAW